MLPSLSTIILSTSIAATASLVLSPLCCRLAPALGAMDVPRDERRMHRRPIPRSGGLAVFPSVFIALAAHRSDLLLPLLIGGAVIFAAGLSDDVISLSPMKKLAAQSAASLLTLVIGKELLLPETASAYEIIFAFLWIVLLTNAFNLIDGLDGLCTGVGITVALFVFVISGKAEAVIFSAALIGFLPMNRHPARMFLGDSGAMLIGFILSVLTLPVGLGGNDATGFFSAAMLFAFPIFDTLTAFLRRLFSGHSPFYPDRKHLHHLLIDSGLSHAAASRFLVALSVSCASVGALTATVGLSPITIICFGLLLSSLGCTLLFCITSSDLSA